MLLYEGEVDIFQSIFWHMIPTPLAIFCEYGQHDISNVSHQLTLQDI